MLLLSAVLQGLTAGDCRLLPSVISQVGVYGTMGSYPWWPEEMQQPIIRDMLLTASSAAAPLGLYRSDPAAAAGIHLVQGASAAAGAANHLFLGNNYLGNSLVNLAVKGGMYGGYLACSDDPVSLGRLVTAPVRKFSSPFVWGSVLGFSVLGALSVDREHSVPLWQSDTVEIHGQQYPRAAGIPLFAAGEGINMLITGIGEESWYRGTVYEQLSREIGTGWAKAADALIFSLVHLPQEIVLIESGEMTWGDALGQAALRSGITLLLNTAYDAGGLELSSAVHTWINLALHLSGFLFGGGVLQH